MSSASILPSRTLSQAVQHFASLQPDKPALMIGQQLVSYGELNQQASQIASGLRQRGVRAGDTIAVQLPNTPEFVLTLLAAGWLGATVQMVHMPYRRAELEFLLRHGGASVFVGLRDFKNETPIKTVQALGLTRVNIAVGTAEQAIPSDQDNWLALAQSAPLTSPVEFDLAGPYVLLYTSGTTDNPKGVPVDHARFMNNANASLNELSIDDSSRLLAMAPFSHLYGLFVLEMALLAGGVLSLLPAFSPPAFIDVLRTHQPTDIYGGPAHFKPLLDGAQLNDELMASVRVVCLSGTAVPPELAQAVEAALPNGQVIQLWGMSELQAGSYGRPGEPAQLRHQSAGRASPGTELRVVDDTGNAVLADVEGRLQVCGQSIFAGYLNNETATQTAFIDGWFDTGDLALLAESGALRLTGRSKEIINRGGIKFNPIEIETLIDQLPGIARCAIVPMPDPVLGERACLFVQPSPNAAPLELVTVLNALSAAGVAKFKWPERLELIDALPLTPTQKVMRARLTSQLSNM